jgi:hypothetical protein
MIGIGEPLGAAGLLAAVALVVIHLLERRRRTVAVSTLRLWRQLPPATLVRRRFVPDLLFWLQMAAALVLTAALVQPYLTRRTSVGPGDALVAVVDVSASMGAREAAGARLDLARARVRALVDALAPGLETLLVSAGARPAIVLPWTADRAAVRAGLETLTALDVGTNLAPAIDVALASADAHGAARIVVVTDLPREESGVAPELLARLDYVQIGRTDDNVGLTSVRVDADPFAPLARAVVTAEVRSFTHVARRVTVTARSGERTWASRTIDLPPRAIVPVSFTQPPTDGVTTLVLDAGDALAADDTAVVWVPPAIPLDLLVVSDDDAFVRTFRALAHTVPGARADVMSRAAYRTAPPRTRGTLVLDGLVPDGPPGTAMLVVAPPSGQSLCPASRRLAGAAVVDWEAEHPALAGLGDLQALDLADVRALEAPAWGTSAVLAAAPGLTFPLLVTGEHEGARVACLGARVGRPLASADDVPLLVLLLGTLRWLSEPAGAAPVVSATGVPVLVGDTVVVPERVGAQAIATSHGQQLVLANLFDARESDIGREAEGEWPATAGAGDTAAFAPRTPIAWWLTLAAALVLGLEWTLWAWQ